ncbi:MAG TPA: TIGR03960 family B12-binding radical SAM protein [Candidatus Omnitrophota bacterium]|nr:TIGR03960 family B12-binding radical SAM protein [Candidatus Omnitrophota bacterium]
MDIEKWLEGVLLEVRKPARYIGNEWNVVRKDLSKQEGRFAVCFPDLYELGMSNLGLRIIYGLLNEQPGVSCERVFLPDVDLQALLKKDNVPLFSLESKAPLSEFDFLGFSLSYELGYTNVLAILDLAGIPLLAKERDLSYPLIIAGGSCVSNPEPMADFVDLFLIGEAEEALLEIVEKYKQTRTTKENILRSLAGIDGVYVPSFYEQEYNSDGSFKGLLPKYPDIPVKINKRIVRDLNQAYYPAKWMVPYIPVVHDRAAVELMRGCPHCCSFCQARSVYHSLRLRSPEKVVQLSREALSSSGYEELSFLSLSTSEYPYLNKVIASLGRELEQKGVSVSLPSLRPKSYLGELVEYLAKVRKTTLTFAPEAGSQRLRQSINKNFSMEEFFSAVSQAYKNGWQAIKLYFMIGLPGEDYSDLDGILEIAQKVSSLKKEFSRYSAEVRLSLSFFVPKPHTNFEREAMGFEEALRGKAAYLKDKSRGLSKKIRLDFHNLKTSVLEAVFSRGSRRLGEVVLKAYRNGAILDGWSEHFKPDAWGEAFKECSLRPDDYLSQKHAEESLPWQHIVL